MLDIVQYAIGCACLAGMAFTAVYGIVATIASKRRQILAALRGHPVTPAASLAPHASSNPQRRSVEAAAAPAFSSDRNAA